MTNTVPPADSFDVPGIGPASLAFKVTDDLAIWATLTLKSVTEDWERSVKANWVVDEEGVEATEADPSSRLVRQAFEGDPFAHDRLSKMLVGFAIMDEEL